MRCQVLIGSVLVAGALAVPAPAQAADPATTITADPATTTAFRYDLATTDVVADVLAVGSEVWVAAGNSVLITSATGKVRTTVTGLLGAKGLTLSPDGASVYVSESTAGKIAQVSAAGQVIGTWTSQACPGRSSIVGAALYYAYSCSNSVGGVGRLDLTDHTDSNVLTDSGVGALTAAGTRLITYPTRSTGGTITAFTVNDDGTLTKGNSVSLGTFYDVAISPDSSRFLVTQYEGGYGVARYDSTTMAKDGDFLTGAYPTAVAWSPDGKRFAGILDAHYDTKAVHIFDAATGAELVATPAAGTTSFTNDAHRASWSADGKTIFSLAQEWTKTAYLVATPTAGLAKTSVSVTLAAAKAYGKNLTITVRTPQRPRTAARVSVVQNGSTLVRNVTTNASGVATASVPARANGKVTVTTAADTKYLGASASASFRTPSALSVQMLRGTTKKGVVHYKSISAVLGAFRVLPARAAKVTVTLQYKSGKSWKSGARLTLAAENDGILGIYLKSGNKKVTYRFVGSSAADTTAGASPSVSSRAFIID